MTGVKKERKSLAGFTTLELILVLAIFVVTSTSLASTFLYSQRLERSTSAKLTADSEARFTIEAIAREIRRDQIDYFSYAGTIDPIDQTELKLKDLRGRSIIFKKNVVTGIGVAQVSVDGGVVWSDLTSNKVDVQVLRFYIAPATDPFATQAVSNEQPRVTIAGSFKSLEKDSPQLPTIISTTITSRFYGR